MHENHEEALWALSLVDDQNTRRKRIPSTKNVLESLCDRSSGEKLFVLSFPLDLAIRGLHIVLGWWCP